jgi:hypothetical protein
MKKYDALRIMVLEFSKIGPPFIYCESFVSPSRSAIYGVPCENEGIPFLNPSIACHIPFTPPHSALTMCSAILKMDQNSAVSL